MAKFEIAEKNLLEMQTKNGELEGTAKMNLKREVKQVVEARKRGKKQSWNNGKWRTTSILKECRAPRRRGVVWETMRWK